jgi:MATE family multidrug resistance protein
MAQTETLSAIRQGGLAVRIGQHIRELARLALPVVVARAGLIVMQLVDTIVVGRYATEALAQLSIGTAPFHVVLGTGVGLIVGTLVMTANAVGRGADGECGAVWHRGVIYAALIGLVGIVFGFLTAPFLAATGQTADMARSGGAVAVILAYGLPASLVYTASAFFLEGLKRPMPGMVLMILANIVNALANIVLVFGLAGFPELGAEGSAWASTIARLFLAVAIVLYIWIWMPERRRFGVRRWPGWRWHTWGPQRRIGYGSGASIMIESGAFSALTLLAGLMGDDQLAAYSIGLNLLALIFMIALGIGAATAVRVGNAFGRRDSADLALAGWVGVGVNSAVMLLLGIVLRFGGTGIARAYTRDPAVIPLVLPIIAVMAFILIVDGAQVVMNNALRGRHDAVVPTVLHGIAYVVIMIPLGWLLGLHFGRGAFGLFEAILVASVASAAFQIVRFQVLARRDRTKRVFAAAETC